LTGSPSLTTILGGIDRETGLALSLSLFLRRIPILAVAAIVAGHAFHARAAAAVIRVPADQPTIQSAINVASPGDTVLVAPGIYYEHIDFRGKGITVESARGSATTIIDGQGAPNQPVATFASQETAHAVLRGFTIQHGQSTSGAGVYIAGASPTIEMNIVTNNLSHIYGGGVFVTGTSTPLITKNTISDNLSAWGGGIDVANYPPVTSPPTPSIIANTIDRNTSQFGGGISVQSPSSTLIQGNTIAGNIADVGGGLSVYGDADITNNVISENTAVAGVGQVGSGADLYLEGQFAQNLVYDNPGIAVRITSFGPPFGHGATVISNTIAAGPSTSSADPTPGSALVTQNRFIEVANNILVGSSGGPSLHCDGFYDDAPPVVEANDIIPRPSSDAQPSPLPGAEICGNVVGVNGNISADPAFRNPAAGDYRLRPSSLCINAGDTDEPGLMLLDLTGRPRVIGPSVDDGVYEAPSGRSQPH
jgi:hypothetical protein